MLTNNSADLAFKLEVRYGLDSENIRLLATL